MLLICINSMIAFACSKQAENCNDCQMQLGSIKIQSYSLNNVATAVDTFQQAELFLYVDGVLHARRSFQPQDEVPLGLINTFSEQTGELSSTNQVPFEDGAEIEIEISWYSFFSSGNGDTSGLTSISRLASLQSSQAFMPSIKTAYPEVVFSNDWLEVSTDLLFEPYVK